MDIKTLAEHIICHDDYSDQFKINFVVLAVSLLMRNNQKPFVNHHVLKSLRNVSAIGQLDWCQFVMESLRYNTKDWVKKGKKNHFGGPLLFLMVQIFWVTFIVSYYGFKTCHFPVIILFLLAACLC